MKNGFILIFAMVIISFSGHSQEVRTKEKTYSSYSRGYSNGSVKGNYFNFKRTKMNFEGHLAGIGLGYSGLISSIGNFSLPNDAKFMSQKANSISFELTPYSYSIGISRRVGFVTALGLEVNNFKFDNNISLGQNENGYVVAKPYETLEKSKLVTAYITLPILFEVQIGKYSNMFLNFGVIGAWKMQSHTKIKGYTDELNGKYKNKRGLNIRNFRYGYMAQIGYEKVGVFAKYYPDPIFKKNLGPKTREINIGLIFYFNDFIK